MMHAPPGRPPRQSQHRGRRGFTLVEVMVTLPLVALLFAGVMDLFLAAGRMSSKTNAQIQATQDSANATQHVVELAREGQYVTLSDEWGTASPLPGYSPANDFQVQMTRADGSTETVDTAIELTMPAPLTPAEADYSGGNFASITVKDNAGQDRTLSPTGTPPSPFFPYSRADTQTVRPVYLIYRSNADGTPNPASGGCLWEKSVQGSPVVNAALCSSIATGAPNAVQFVRPVANADAHGNGGTPQPYQVEVKVISGLYSAIGGVQTGEQGNGTYTSQLVGKCVLMRDHATYIAPSSGAHVVHNPFASY